MFRDRRRHLARQGEPGAAVRDPHRFVTVDRLHVPPAVDGVREPQDGVGVRVIDVRMRNESMQECFDRRTRRPRLHQALHEVADHLVVAHRAALTERLEVVQTDAGELLRFDRLEVRAAPLDAHDAHAPAAEIGLRQLDRRVPPAPDHQTGVAADQTGTVDEQVQALEAPDFFVAPQVVHDPRIILDCRAPCATLSAPRG